MNPVQHPPDDTAQRAVSQQSAQPFTDRLLSGEQVDLMLSIKKTKRYELLKAGDLPAPVHISPRCVRYKESQILAYISSLSEKAV